MDTMIITRKFVLVPVASCKKEWGKKATAYIVSDTEDKLDFFKEKLKKVEKEMKKAKDSEQLSKEYNRLCSKKEEYESLLKDAEDGVFNQKAINNYTYHLVREAMESEARRKNYILSWAFSEMIANGVPYMETYKEKCKFINEMIKPAYRTKGSKKGSLFDDSEIQNILGGYGVSFKQELTQKLKDCVKDGLLEGKVVLPNYKLDSPFTVEKTHVSLSHDFETYEELCEHIGKKDGKIYLNYGGHGESTIAKFAIDTGSNKNKEELNTALLRLISGAYEVCGSSIGLCKDGKKIVMNLSMKIPKTELELDEKTVVGVDLGIAVPAYCALNNNIYSKKAIGSAAEFLRIRTQLQSQYRRLQKQVAANNGGHGRNKKMKPLDRFREKERNFVKTYNHYVSKEVVEFAVKNKAKYINMEDLSGFKGNDDRILRNWSYYELQQFIEYKAAKYGIEVRYINPYHTSQVCSCCGHWEEGQRMDQAHFVCKKCGTELNADYNAARNISMSTEFKKQKLAA